MPLRIALPDAPHGESILLSLIWPRGCRHLHLAPRLSPSHLAFAFERTLAFPAEDDPVAKRASVDALARTLASLSAGGTVQHERGFGIELELLMPHGLDPELRSKSSFDTSGVAATIGAIAEQVSASAACSEVVRAEVLPRLLTWDVGTDHAIRGVPPEAAAQTIKACAPGLSPDASARAMRLLGGEEALCHQTELRSPPPPNELSFAAGADAELRALLELLQRAQAAAPCFERTHGSVAPEGHACDGAAALHVHVNVTNPAARGAPLTARQIILVALAWVRFDLVLARLSAPWFWALCSTRPLFATGPEFSGQHAARSSPASAFRQSPWHWRTKAARIASVASSDDACASYYQRAAVTRQEPADFEMVKPDACAFFLSAHDVFASTRHLAASAEREQTCMARLFGDGRTDASSSDLEGSSAPRFTAQLIGKFSSFNLLPVARLGTVEMRRFHSTLDGELAAAWARFCVAFVEAFKDGEPARAQEAMLDAAEACDGLIMLQAAQQRASIEDLLALMHAHLERATVDKLMGMPRRS